ncbi:hypothetical protein T02_7393 [Trichinella nativa]|uniref:Uncharacterized protein n=1 Tax=Trichinella nativa TaxID=6335 RepID=A0A0V1LMX1_9BILA|nr:hypothetical protein T02_7393 [Trichinella nativa]
MKLFLTVSITVMKLKNRLKHFNKHSKLIMKEFLKNASYEELHLVPILLCSVMRARLILEKDLSNSNNVQVRNDLQSINAKCFDLAFQTILLAVINSIIGGFELPNIASKLNANVS